MANSLEPIVTNSNACSMRQDFFLLIGSLKIYHEYLNKFMIQYTKQQFLTIFRTL